MLLLWPPVASFYPGKALRWVMAGRELWPNAALLPSSVFCSLLTGAHAWYCTALCSQPGIGIASSYCSVPQGPWRLTVAAGVPHSTKEFAKELCCCYKYWLLASVSSSLYLETMEESWPAGCPVGRGALSMLLVHCCCQNHC